RLYRAQNAHRNITEYEDSAVGTIIHRGHDSVSLPIRRCCHQRADRLNWEHRHRANASAVGWITGQHRQQLRPAKVIRVSSESGYDCLRIAISVVIADCYPGMTGPQECGIAFPLGGRRRHGQQDEPCQHASPNAIHCIVSCREPVPPTSDLFLLKAVLEYDIKCRDGYACDHVIRTNHEVEVVCIASGTQHTTISCA